MENSFRGRATLWDDNTIIKDKDLFVNNEPYTELNRLNVSGEVTFKIHVSNYQFNDSNNNLTINFLDTKGDKITTSSTITFENEKHSLIIKYDDSNVRNVEIINYKMIKHTETIPDTFLINNITHNPDTWEVLSADNAINISVNGIICKDGLTIETSKPIKIVISAKTGYKILSEPSLTLSMKNGTTIMQNYKWTNVNDMFTCDNINNQGLYNIKVSSNFDVIKPEPTTLPYSESLTNATSNLTGKTTIDIGQNTISLTAKSGYHFESKFGKIEYTTTTGTTNYSVFTTDENNNTKATGSLNVTNAMTKISVSASAIKTDTSIIVPYSENLTNSTSNLTGITNIDISTNNLVVTLNAKTGYHFHSLDNKFGLIKVYRKSTIPLTYSFNLKDSEIDVKTLSQKIYLGSDLNDVEKINIAIDAVEDEVPTPPETTNKFVNIYNVTSQELNTLSQERILWLQNVSGENVEASYIDIGQFITALYNLPFDVSSLTGDKENIELGIKTAVTKSTVINSTTLKFDLGKIKVTEKYHSNNDYLNTDISLYLPFADSISLETNVIEHEISISCSVDLYSGTGYYIIKDDNDNILENVKVNFAQEIPFMQTSSNKISNRPTSLFDNGVRTPYIKVTRNIPVKEQYHETSDYGLISDNTGYITVDNLKIITNASFSEQNTIQSELRNGVFINE